MRRASFVATTAALVATIVRPLEASAAEPPFPAEAVGLRQALYVDQHGLGPSDTPGSVTCDDARPRSAVTISTPWCSLTNGAFAQVLPGDIVWVRAGTYTHSATGAQASFPKFAFALTRRGSPTHHIWYSAYPGESVSIEPARPDGGPANCTFNGGGANNFSAASGWASGSPRSAGSGPTTAPATRRRQLDEGRRLRDRRRLRRHGGKLSPQRRRMHRRRQRRVRCLQVLRHGERLSVRPLEPLGQASELVGRLADPGGRRPGAAVLLRRRAEPRAGSPSQITHRSAAS